jgi:hypothetical protein
MQLNYWLHYCIPLTPLMPCDRLPVLAGAAPNNPPLVGVPPNPPNAGVAGSACQMQSPAQTIYSTQYPDAIYKHTICTMRLYANFASVQKILR